MLSAILLARHIFMTCVMVPGPLFARHTFLWKAWHLIRGTHDEAVLEAHHKYGSQTHHHALDIHSNLHSFSKVQSSAFLPTSTPSLTSNTPISSRPAGRRLYKPGSRRTRPRSTGLASSSARTGARHASSAKAERPPSSPVCPFSTKSSSPR